MVKNVLYVGIHQNEIPDPKKKNKKDKKFEVAFNADIVQVFIWNNRLWLYESKMQSIYNTLIEGYNNSNKQSKLFVIHADYLLQLFTEKKFIKERSIEDYKTLNTIAYNLQKYINKNYTSKSNTSKTNASKSSKTQVAINIHLPKDLYKSKARMLMVFQMIRDYSANNILILLENVSSVRFSNYLVSYVRLKYYFKKLEKKETNERLIPSSNIGMTIDTAHIVGSGFDLQTMQNIFSNVQSKNMLETDLRDEVRLIHLNGNEKTKNSKQDKHVSVFSELDNVFVDTTINNTSTNKDTSNKKNDKQQSVQNFIQYVKTEFKKCYGFILERNDLVYSQEEYDKLTQMVKDIQK